MARLEYANQHARRIGGYSFYFKRSIGKRSHNFSKENAIGTPTIIESVSPEPGLAYKSSWYDGLPQAIARMDWHGLAGKAAAGAVVGIVVALFVGFVKRRRKK